jgi:hypothetical protein
MRELTHGILFALDALCLLTATLFATAALSILGEHQITRYVWRETFDHLDERRLDRAADEHWRCVQRVCERRAA